jgi:glycosyl transferase family 4
MKRLLAVSWEMPPMYGPRGTQVARTLGALVPLGWQPTVVCLDPRRGGPNWRDGIDAPPPPGVEARRVRSPEEWAVVRAMWRLLPSMRDRPDSKWVWIHAAAEAAKGLAAAVQFDGLVTFAQPWSDHLVGLRVHRETRLPWVAHFSDPWIDSPYWRGTASQRAAAAKMESAVIKEADAVVFVTDEAAQRVMRKYPDEWRRKVAVVPHGWVPASTKPAKAEPPLRLVYTGRFYEGLRTPTALLRAIAKLNSEQSLDGTLELTCIGPFVTAFAREAAALGIDRIVRFRDRVSSAEAQSIAAEADMLLVVDAPTEGPSPFLPSKLIDYLPLRKPILGITPLQGASAALLKRLGGFVAAPNDEGAIRIALTHVLTRWRDGALGVGQEFDRVAAEYDIAKTTTKFSDVLTRAFA